MAEINSNIQNENAQVATAGLTANAHVPTTARTKDRKMKAGNLLTILEDGLIF